ncbi:TAXI family TRAP transporter solute-binding subunit [Amaricoccus solimangrovi]|uniref:TAXI family TRAP transporter solute-binding subunit n=1 Tax=Amaricoccus solimangrovi TaxID=2589815 RepID=A0A501WVP8_9RHOB|nr:TAXI family TRAP transporter solute-binding subunit [Amaricoccus solimangrovi]TPE51031.1 TAXI family TRAP transporter solute-binding subunit [Amaricoccus solimangrovi]
MTDESDTPRARGLRPGLASLLLALGLAAPAPAADQTLISIGTGGKTGVYYLVGGAICDLVNARRWETGIRCLTEASDGSIQNLRDVRSGARTFGLVQSDWQYHAVGGTAVFAEVGPDRELRSVLGLFPEPFTVVARPGAGIRGFGDLRGKRVSLGPAGSGGRATMGVVMAAMGWTEADFAYVADTPMPDTARALCAGEIDAAIFIVAHPNLTVEEMEASCGAALVPVAGPGIERLVAANGYYRPAEIPAGSYPEQTGAVPTFALTATLVTSARTPPSVVDSVARAVFADLPKLRDAHPALARLEPAEMLSAGLTAPLAEGVAEASREATATPGDGE